LGVHEHYKVENPWSTYLVGPVLSHDGDHRVVVVVCAEMRIPGVVLTAVHLVKSYK
jgi:hypothetical protein